MYLQCTDFSFKKLSTGSSHERFGGIEPWRNYQVTANGVENTIPQLQSRFQAMPKTSLVTNVQLNASHLPSTNVVSVTNTTTAAVMDKLEEIKLATRKYNTRTYAVIYSILFFIILVFLNALLCFSSLAISRLILREMIAAARPYSTFCLLITNFLLVLNISSVFLLFLTVLDTPIIWYFLPVIFLITAHSFALFYFGTLRRPDRLMGIQQPRIKTCNFNFTATICVYIGCVHILIRGYDLASRISQVH
jgi:hypothetical protein